MREDLPKLGLSTRWNATRQPNLEAAVDEIVALGIGLIEVAVPAQGIDTKAVRRGFDKHRARCHGLVLPEPEVERFLIPHLLQQDRDLRERAERHLQLGIKTAAALRAPRIALNLGSIAIEFEEQRLDDLEQALKRRDQATQDELMGTILAARNRRRDEALEALCRRLFDLKQAEPGLQLVILPRADPLSVPNLEECGYLLDDLGPFVALRLDLAEIGLRESLGLESLEAWVSAFEGRADATYHADFHGFKTDLPPGAGLLGERLWRLGLSPQLPTILKLDPASSRLTVEEAIRRLR